jgi:hypothetical protein
MTDIVERLRATAAGVSLMHQHEHDEAADEIDRLRDLLAYNRIDPDAVVKSAKGAADTYKKYGV